MKQYLCPDCGQAFSLWSYLMDHQEDEHPAGDDHSVPPEMRWMLGSAVESGGFDDDEY